MICQACGLDKKILVPKNEDFLAGAEGLGSLCALPKNLRAYAYP